MTLRSRFSAKGDLMKVDVGAELQVIRREYGKLTPSLVVDAARDPVHPLHSRFDWNDTTAGESWRRHQARELIRFVKVRNDVADPEESDASVRAFHAIRTKTEFVYEPVEVVAADPDMKRQVLEDAAREFRILFLKYRNLEGFFDRVRSVMLEYET